jgi:hypothetical protein
VVAALADDPRRAVPAPNIEQPAVGTLRAAKGRLPRDQDDEWPIASVIAVRADLLDLVGGVDSRFGCPLGWADLVDQLLTQEPSLPVIKRDLLGPAPVYAQSDWTADARPYSANRTPLRWRLVARLLRDRVEDDGQSRLLDPQFRRVFRGD